MSSELEEIEESTRNQEREIHFAFVESAESRDANVINEAEVEKEEIQKLVSCNLNRCKMIVYDILIIESQLYYMLYQQDLANSF